MNVELRVERVPEPPKVTRAIRAIVDEQNLTARIGVAALGLAAIPASSRVVEIVCVGRIGQGSLIISDGVKVTQSPFVIVFRSC